MGCIGLQLGGTPRKETPIPKLPPSFPNLTEKIIDLILKNGPIGLDRYMELCLFDKEFGYYTTRDPFGSTGDFITAPEISQMFGELIGAWSVEVWHRLGAPKQFNLIELGPGQGTLMNDLLRTIKLEPAFLKTIELQLVEISPKLKKLQQRTLKKHDIPITWYKHINDIPVRPSIIIANEFLDAFPIQQHIYKGGDWFERVVKIKDSCGFSIGTNYVHSQLSEHTKQIPLVKNGDILEISDPRSSYFSQICKIIKSQNSACLLIDYGYTKYSIGDTLQAIKDHQFVDILESPGESDLTAHVNFAELIDLTRNSKLITHGPITQQEFLVSLGLIERAGKLGYNKEIAVQRQIQNDVNRLVEQMGTIFKVVALTSKNITLPGFNY